MMKNMPNVLAAVLCVFILNLLLLADSLKLVLILNC